MCSALVEADGGDIYVVGTFRGHVRLGFAELNLQTPTGAAHAAHLTRMTPEADIVWNRLVRSDGDLEIVGASRDSVGDIYVVGNRSGALYFGDGERFATKLPTGSGKGGAFIAKFRGHDGGLLWAQPVASGHLHVVATSLAVTSDGVVFVAGDYEHLGRDGFIERIASDGTLTRRLLFDGPAFRGPLQVSAAGADTLVVTGATGAGGRLPSQRRDVAVDAHDEVCAFVAKYAVDDFLLRDIKLLPSPSILAIGHGPQEQLAVLSRGDVEAARARLDVFDAEGAVSWSERLTTSPGAAATLKFTPDGTLMVTRELGPQRRGPAHRAEQGIAPVRGDADAAITVFSPDKQNPRTFTAGGSGQVSVRSLLPAGDDFGYVCGQYTETAVFWKTDDSPAIFNAGTLPTSYVSKLQLR